MPHLALSAFGTFQATLDSEQVMAFTRLKTQCLLAYLALETRPHSRESLATLLWPLDNGFSARANLRQTLYELRKLLSEREDSSTPFLLVTRQTVQFNPDADYAFDVVNFQTHIQAGRLAAAVALYQGELLAGLSCESEPFEEWLRQQRAHFHNLMIDLCFRLTNQALQQGDFFQARSYAQRQLTLESWREEAHRQLMTALTLSGERSAALAQYETCRRLLADELGVEPDAETAALYEQIKAGKLRGSQPGSLPALQQLGEEPIGRQAEPPMVRHNLPPQPTAFVGRQTDLAQIAARIAAPTCRLLTIVGPGGMGKTRLAIQSAQAYTDADKLHFTDGVFCVALAGVAAPDLLVSTIATALDFTFYGSSEPKTQLQDYLRQRAVLIVLDNCEHLLEGIELVSDLLGASSQLKVLATSREPLNLREEWLHPLAGMSYPGADTETAPLESYTAVQFFAQCARRMKPDFDLTAEAAAVVHICQLVEGMPLGLELAATWLKHFSCSQIATEIERNLDFLATTLRNVPERHRSIRALFEHSWNLLSGQEQQVLQRLAVFRGGFDRIAAEQVAGASFSLLVALAEKSLIQVALGERYQMHELLRQFAVERLKASQADYEQVRARHCIYYSTFLLSREESLKGRGQLAALGELEGELENIRAAWKWAVTYHNLDGIDRAMESLELFYIIKCSFGEGVTVFQQAAEALAMDEPIGQQGMIYAKVLAKQGLFQLRLFYEMNEQDSRTEIRRLLTTSLSILRRLNAQTASAAVLLGLRELAIFEQQYELAEQLVPEIQAIYERTGDRKGMIALLESQGFSASVYTQKKQYFRRAINLAQAVGDLRQLGQLLNVLGEAHLDSGEYDEAKQLAQAALAARQSVKDRRGVAFSLWLLGESAWRQGNYEEAKQHSLQSLAMFEELGLRWGADYALNNLGNVALLEGDRPLAKRYFMATLVSRLTADTLHHDRVPVALTGVAQVLMAENQLAQAAALLYQVLRHPNAWPQTQARATELLAVLSAELPKEEIAVAQTQSEAQGLIAAVLELLNE